MRFSIIYHFNIIFAGTIIIFALDFIGMNREEKRHIKERKRRLKKQRKEYLRREKESVKRQKMEMKEKVIPMKRRIRREKRRAFVRNIKEFFRKPVRRKKISASEKILRKQVQKDIRYYTIKRIVNFPREIVKATRLYFKIRKLWITNFLMAVSEKIGHFKAVMRTKELRNAYLTVAVNSTVLFVLAFLISYLINQFVTVFTAKILNIPSELYSYRIYWPLYTYSTLYSRQVLVLIFGMGPFISFLLGILFYRLFIVFRYRSVYMKLFFIWASISSFTLFFGAYISGAVTRTGFIYASEWLFLNNMFDIKEIIFIILSVVSLMIIGFMMTRAFLQASNSSALIEPRVRVIYIFSAVIIPYLLGITILYALNFPNNPTELLLLYLSPLLISIVTLFRYNGISLQKIAVMRIEGKYRISVPAVILLIMILIFFRTVLYKGVSF